MSELSDRDFILNPDHWPRWPFLPLKNPQKDLHGTLTFARLKGGPNPNGEFVIHLINIFSLGLGGANPNQQLVECPKHVYPDIDTMLTDGWIVD